MKDLGQGKVEVVEVGEGGAGQRLDNFLLRHLKGAPKSLIYRIIRSGEVRVNKGRADASTKLAATDLVRVPPVRLEAKPEGAPVPVAGSARAGTDLPILFEDDALLAINKPAGLAVHGGSGVRFGVIEALRAARPEAKFLELVHRIDRDTSGVLLLAKKRAALVAMHELLREGRTDKRYFTLVAGRWPHDAKHHITTALAKYVTSEGERRVSESDDENAYSKDAHTVVSVIKRFAGATLLEAQIKTGRTHQIRVHLTGAGHPIIGDDKYGDFALNKAEAKRGLKRMFLHAAKISFVHPLTQTRLRIEAPLPPECERYLALLSSSKLSQNPHEHP
jgi:23S rRNA pseudouridine955/2504/2580 synthase